MLLLNFSHPLTPEQTDRIETLTGQKISRLIPIATQFDNEQPFLPQLRLLMEQIPLTAGEWQNEPLLVIPPALNFITALLLAELHGRMGYFPSMARISPVVGSMPTTFKVSEILNLQEIREHARTLRSNKGNLI